MAQSAQAPPDTPPDVTASPAPPARAAVRRRWAAGGVVAVLAVVALVIAVAGGGAGSGRAPAAAAAVVPADALVYIDVSLHRGQPAVAQALAVARRFPDFPLAYAAGVSKLGAVVGGGRPVDFATQVSPWLGGDAALALLNTTTSTAGSLVVLKVTDAGRARSFLTSVGATAHGSYRGQTLRAYPNGNEAAFVGSYLVIGQDASVRAAIDVTAGAGQSLAAAAAYRRATATEPAGRVLTAYASLAGVRRVLAPQGGVLGALGDLLYQPALQGVAVSASPTSGGARIDIHSALDPSLTAVSGAAAAPFAPTLQNLMPSDVSLMLDVTALDKVAPQVLNAGTAAGVAGGIGPLLSRLGSALSSEGVNVKDIVSIFHGEAAVAIVGAATSPKLVIVARTPHPARTQTELAELEAPLAQLFATKGAASEPVFNDRQVAGITAHQLQLTTGLQLDYAVFRGLVVISTSLDGIAAVAQQAHPLARNPSFAFALGNRPKLVTTLVFADLAQLLSVGKQTGLTSSSVYNRLAPDLKRITAAGLSSTRHGAESDAQLSLQIR